MIFLLIDLNNCVVELPESSFSLFFMAVGGLKTVVGGIPAVLGAKSTAVGEISTTVGGTNRTVGGTNRTVGGTPTVVGGAPTVPEIAPTTVGKAKTEDFFRIKEKTGDKTTLSSNWMIKLLKL